MKKVLKMLVLGLLTAALLCCTLPVAFAAEDGQESQTYTIGLDAMGGTSSVVVATTNLNGRLSAVPASPTLEGYTFDGWYTEPVGGTKITTSTVFSSDTTVYAHWSVKAAASSSSSTTTKPAQQPAQTETDNGHVKSILVVAGALLTTLAVAAFM